MNTTMKCYLESIFNRARFWLFAGSHVEFEDEKYFSCVFLRSRLKFALKAGSRSGFDHLRLVSSRSIIFVSSPNS